MRNECAENRHQPIRFAQRRHEAIAFLGATERKMITVMAKELVASAFPKYLGAKVTERSRLDRERRERGERSKPDPIIQALRRWAKQNGYNVDKFLRAY